MQLPTLPVPVGHGPCCYPLLLLGVADVLHHPLDEPPPLLADFFSGVLCPERLEQRLRGRVGAGREVLCVEEVVEEGGELDYEEIDWRRGRGRRGKRAGNGEGKEPDAVDVVEVVGGVVLCVVCLGEVGGGVEER